MVNKPDWQPQANLCELKRRAALLASIRQFFAARAVLEVTTPVVVKTPSLEPSIRNFALGTSNAGGYLRTSPESALKRMLAAGFGDVYEIGPVFRHDEAGAKHTPEFTMLEWYRVDFDHHQLMDEVAALLAVLGMSGEPRRMTYAELFHQGFKRNPHEISDAALHQLAAEQGLALGADTELDRALCFDFLYVQCLEPLLLNEGAAFLFDYPRELRAYARLSETEPKVAKRFELIINGLEIANGYHEIVDANEQASCFAAEGETLRRRNEPSRAIDRAWLQALEAGMPACAGVAVGLERLLMALHGLDDISMTQSFPFPAS